VSALYLGQRLRVEIVVVEGADQDGRGPAGEVDGGVGVGLPGELLQEASKAPGVG